MNAEETRRMDAERRLFKRLVISFFDLIEARNYLARLRVERNGSPLEPGDEVIRSALETSFTVAYARPFSGNRNASDVAADISGKFVRNLPPDQSCLHEEILRRRNEEFAHSDPGVADVTISVIANYPSRSDVLPISAVTRVPMADDALRSADALCDALYVFIFDEMQRLRLRLSSGESF